MPTTHVIQQGETVVSVSERYGFSAETLWKHPANEALRQKRGRIDVLLPGDELVIPDVREKVLPAATGRRHVFRRKGIPAVFRLVLRERGEPRVGVAYRLLVAGAEIRGVTKDDGLIEAAVPASATEAKLYLNDSEAPIELRFGHMDPVDAVPGVRKRLQNLGLPAPADEELTSEAWRRAIGKLQERAELPRTGVLDAATQKALVELHDRRGGSGGAR